MPSVHETLYFAVVSGDFSAVRRCVAQGANVNFKHPLRAYQSSLHEAAARDYAECSLFLIEKGAVVDEKDAGGATPLHKACYFGKIRSVQALLSRNADVRLKDSKGFSALHYACRSTQMSSSQIFSLLQQIGKDVDATDSHGRTPLHVAALSGNLPCARLALECSADPEKKDDDGRTPLFWAVLSNQLPIVEMLVMELKVNVNTRDKHGRTPIFWAVSNGFKQIAEILLAAGTAVQWKDDEGRSVLHWIASSPVTDTQIELAKMIVNQHAPLITSTDKQKSTALHAACCLPDHAPMVSCLLSLGADKDARDVEGRSSMDHAAFIGDEVVLNILLEAGASVDPSPVDNKSALSWAAGQGHAGCVKKLIASGALVNAKDNESRTPIFWAVQFGHLELVKSMVAAGASLHVRDKYGRSALFAALQNGHWPVVEFIMSQHPKLHLRDTDGKSLLHAAVHAVTEDGLKSVEALLKAGVDLRTADSAGWTVVHEAAVCGNTAACRLLVREYGGDVLAKNREQKTARDLAAMAGHTATVEVLYEEEMRRRLLADQESKSRGKPEPIRTPISPPAIASVASSSKDNGTKPLPNITSSANVNSTQSPQPAQRLPPVASKSSPPQIAVSASSTPSAPAKPAVSATPANVSLVVTSPQAKSSPAGTAGAAGTPSSSTKPADAAFIERAKRQSRLAELLKDLDDEDFGGSSQANRPDSTGSLLSAMGPLDLGDSSDEEKMPKDVHLPGSIGAGFVSTIDISPKTRQIAIVWRSMIR
jgi:ankyrin repeat protein